MKRIETIDVPQANSLIKVCNLLALVGVGIEDKRELARQLGFVSREIDYYKHAARILGFAHFVPGKEFYLSEQGEAYLSGLRPEEKKLMLGRAVRGAEVFEELLAEIPEKDLSRVKITRFIQDRTNLNRTTAQRRADTMLAWLRYTKI